MGVEPGNSAGFVPAMRVYEVMRRAAKVDLIQRATVKALRDIGASVRVTSQVGQGFPDLVCGYRGKTFLLELKTGNEGLTVDEKEFHASWGGHYAIVRSPEEAQTAIIRESMR